jgi:RND family efflux transporter MFP subunit
MVVIVSASAAAVALARRGTSSKFYAAPPNSGEMVAKRAPAQPSDEFIGVIVASESIEISSRNDGRIESVHVRLGDRVKAGQVLASLDARALRAELAMAKAAAGAAQADVQRAALEQKESQSRYERRAHLAKGIPAISQEEVESSRYQAELAGPRLAVAEATAVERSARVRKLEQELADAALVSPFAGIVAARYVDPGAQVARGVAVLRVIRAEGTWVRFAAPDAFRSRVIADTLVDLKIDGSDIELTGAIETVAPEIDPSSRLIIAEARLDVDPSDREKVLGRVARVKPR